MPRTENSPSGAVAQDLPPPSPPIDIPPSKPPHWKLGMQPRRVRFEGNDRNPRGRANRPRRNHRRGGAIQSTVPARNHNPTARANETPMPRGSANRPAAVLERPAQNPQATTNTHLEATVADLTRASNANPIPLPKDLHRGGTTQPAAVPEDVAQISEAKSNRSAKGFRRGEGFLRFFQARPKPEPKPNTQVINTAAHNQQVTPTGAVAPEHPQNTDDECAIVSEDEEGGAEVPIVRPTRKRNLLPVYHHSNYMQIRLEGKPAWEQHRNGKVFMGPETFIMEGKIRPWEMQGGWGEMRMQTSREGYEWHCDELDRKYDAW